MEWIGRQLRAFYNNTHPLIGKRVLDVGCGGGILSESLALAGAQVTGLDVSDKSLAIARNHAEENGLAIEYEHNTAEALATRGAKFDIVFNMEVVEHVADVDSFMQACGQCVKPGGVMFVATINRNWLAWLIAIFGAEYVSRWLPKGTHQYAKLRTPKEITGHLARSGLSARSITGVQVNPLNKTMHLSRLTAVNYMIFAT
jgi:2-polyprenyl-6-hydroxyphenyl methylase/3-demethylubiquinone-9 3-methyltransferase